MNLRFWRKHEIYGATLPEANRVSSSQVSDSSYQYVRPEVDFAKCYEYYRTIGKVQNAVESYVSQLLSRDWYYDGPQEGVRQLEEWEERFNLSRLLEYIVRDWLVCGNSIIGVSDWQPVQISSIAGMKRSQYGITEHYVQQVNGREVLLDAAKFVHTQYIELNREAWGVGMFHSLLTTFDYGKKQSMPHLEIYRQQIQLFYKVLVRYGSPVTVWFFDNASKEEFNRQVEELKALEAGERRLFNKKIEIATETIDGRGNLINATSPIINQEIDAGLQTSANRLITQPSAMADARIGSDYDDAKTAAIMERIRRMMNVLVIPRITSGRVEFRWGKQDNFEFDFNQLLQAKGAGFVSAEEGRAILKSVGWKLDDQSFTKRNQQLMQLQKETKIRGRTQNSVYAVVEQNTCNIVSEEKCNWITLPGRGPVCIKHNHGDFVDKEYDEVVERHSEFVKHGTLGNYTYSPVSDRGFDFKTANDVADLYQERSPDGKKELAVFAVTDNIQTDLNEDTRKAFKELRVKGDKPLIGRWKSGGETFTDVVTTMPIDSDDDMTRILKDYKQKEGVIITKEGKVRYIANEG